MTMRSKGNAAHVPNVEKVFSSPNTKIDFPVESAVIQSSTNEGCLAGKT